MASIVSYLVALLVTDTLLKGNDALPAYLCL